MIAFFDMDNTLLACNSAARYARYFFLRGELRARDLLLSLRWLVEYKLAIIDAQAVTRRVIAAVSGDAEEEHVERCQRWFEDDIRHTVTPSARAAVARHKARGERTVILTAATRYIAEPVAELLGMDEVVCTQLEVHAGRFTGSPVEPLCFGSGKIHWARAVAERCGASLHTATFYTDSFTDVPMLRAVGSPIAVNPDLRLRRYARRHHIPIERWR